MLFKNILLGLGGTGIIGGASVGIYYGIKGEEKSTVDSKAVVDLEDDKDTNRESGGGGNSAVPSETDNQQQPQQPKQQ